MNRKSPKPRGRHGFYAELFTRQEQALLDKPVALEDEEKLLRVRVLRLARRMALEMDLKDELGSVSALARMIQMIATLERIRLLIRGKEGQTENAILEALSELDPYEEL
jgi:hypothetical protein